MTESVLPASLKTNPHRAYSGCQKNVPIFKRFFLQPYTRLCRTP